jgi:hypothetical protein
MLSSRNFGPKNSSQVDPTVAMGQPSRLITTKDVQVPSEGIILELKDVEVSGRSTNGDHSSVATVLAIQPSRAFDTCKAINTNRYVYSLPPPTVSELRDRLQALGLPSKIYQAPYYSKDTDIPESSKEYAGLTYRLKGGRGIAWLEEWSTSLSETLVHKSNKNVELNPVGIGGWEYASLPPSAKEVRQSLELLPSTSILRKPKIRSQVKSISGHQISNA